MLAGDTEDIAAAAGSDSTMVGLGNIAGMADWLMLSSSSLREENSLALVRVPRTAMDSVREWSESSTEEGARGWSVVADTATVIRSAVDVRTPPWTLDTNTVTSGVDFPRDFDHHCFTVDLLSMLSEMTY
jgi:hypothetical protein